MKINNNVIYVFEIDFIVMELTGTKKLIQLQT